MKFKFLFIVTVFCLSLMRLAELSLAAADRPEDIEVAGADTVENQYRIVFEGQRPASDFGVKGFGEIIFMEGKPRVVVSGNWRTIVFLDDYGNVHRKRTLKKNEWLALSENAQFLGFTTWGETKPICFVLESSQGEVLQRWNFGLFGDLLISNKGNVVIQKGSHEIDIEHGRLRFYKNTGELVKTLMTDVINSVKISPVGDKVYLANPNSLNVYDIQGKKLWEHSTEGGSILISDDGKFIFNVQKIVERESSYVEIYDDLGLLLGVLQFPHRCTLLGISSDSKFIAVREEKKLHLFETRTQKLKWTYDLETDLIPDFGVMGLNAADVGTDAKLTAIIVTGVQKVGPGVNDFEYSRYIRILDSEGHKIFERFIAKMGAESGAAVQVNVSPKGDAVTAWTGKNMYTFKIERQ